MKMRKFKPALFLLAFSLAVFLAGCSVQTQPGAKDGYTTLGNPAAVYCQSMGYTYQTVSEGEAGETGFCVMPDATKCAAWDFLSGQCGTEFSYCAQNGYETLALEEGGTYTPQHAVCVDSTGKTLGTVEELSKLPENLASCGERSASEPAAVETTTEVFTADVSPDVLPAAFDWRNNNGNWLTPIKDQGVCGSCWAFSAVGIAESALEIAANNPNLNPNLSEQYLVSDCVSYNGYQTCCGGYKTLALQYIRDQGLPDEACMAYVDGSSCSCDGGTCDANCTYSTPGKCSDTTCANRCTNWSTRLTRIKTTGPVTSDPTSIKTALMQKGPLSVALYMGGSFDANAVYNCYSTNTPNHAVILVGYNDAGKYWIVRNSWGSAWNGDGYFKVGYGQCMIESEVTYATAEYASPPSAFSKSSPVSAGSNQPSNPTLSWYASTYAASYEYCIDTVNNNVCDTTWKSTGAVTSALLSKLTPSTAYYWQVRAINQYGTTYGNGGTWWKFTTGPAPSAFSKSSPANASVNQLPSLTLRWYASPTATGYKYCIDTVNNNACDTAWTSTGAATNAPLSGLKASTTYYWQARAINQYGRTLANGGTWWKFTIGSAPTAFSKASPANATAVQPLNLTLRWYASTSVTSYEFCIDAINDAACNTGWISTGTNTAVSLAELNPAKTYYWQVRARNAYGKTKANGGAWWSFTTNN